MKPQHLIQGLSFWQLSSAQSLNGQRRGANFNFFQRWSTSVTFATPFIDRSLIILSLRLVISHEQFTHECREKTQANSTFKGQSQDWNPQPQDCEAKVPTTISPCKSTWLCNFRGVRLRDKCFLKCVRQNGRVCNARAGPCQITWTKHSPCSVEDLTSKVKNK